MTETGPVMKCKIVFLGDQSVGKTSIINRFIFDNFTGNEQVQQSSKSADSGSRLRQQDHQRVKQDAENAAVGYCWSVAFPFADSQLHQGQSCRHHRLRHHQ